MDSCQTVQIPDPKVVVSTADLVRVLVVDDDGGFSDSVVRAMGGLGCSIDVASNPIQAVQHMKKHRYSVVVFDVVLGENDPSVVDGDRLLLDNMGRLPNCEKFIITGKSRGNIKHQADLDKYRVRVYQKDENPFWHDLNDAISSRIKSSPIGISTAMREFALYSVESGAVTPAGSSELLRQAGRILTGWLEKAPDADKPGMVFGGRTFTATELANEIRSGSDVGRAHLEMFLALVQRTFGLTDGEGRDA